MRITPCRFALRISLQVGLAMVMTNACSDGRGSRSAPDAAATVGSGGTAGAASAGGAHGGGATGAFDAPGAGGAGADALAGQVDAPMGASGATGEAGVGGSAGGTTATGSGGVSGSEGTRSATGGALGGAGGASTKGTGGAGGTGGGTMATGGAAGTTTQPWSPPIGCGDGVVTPPERCDDGNTAPYDGCSSDCQNEPICAGTGPCTSRCGDGILVDEACDDGNTVDGDGCSSTCKVESGFTCSQPPLGSPLFVPAVHRDFRRQNPTDFEPGVLRDIYSATVGITKPVLDGDGKPEFSGTAITGSGVASKESFAMWYRDTAGVNHTTVAKLALWSNGAGAYVNRWGANGEQWLVSGTVTCGAVGTEKRDSNGNPIPCTSEADGGATRNDCAKLEAEGASRVKCSVSSDGKSYQGSFTGQYLDGTPLFFPVDGDDFTPASERSPASEPTPYSYSSSFDFPYDLDASGKRRLHNFSFTSEIRYWFEYKANQGITLEFLGDDDVWVFINKQLAVDLGGLHLPVKGSVVLDSATATRLGLVEGQVYEVAVFQAERMAEASTFKITLPGFSTAASVCRRH